jgi:tRNA threonylcarbamoyladenosine biosynthesis protein TsaE
VLFCVGLVQWYNLLMVVKSKSVGETEALALAFTQKLLPRTDEAIVIGLYGDLGAGKTAFTKGIAKALGVKGVVASPTFVIEKIYKTGSALFSHLVHIDAYRLENGSELLSLGWRDLAAYSGNLICIEWPEHVEDVLPAKLEKIHLTFIDDTTREVVINNG